MQLTYYTMKTSNTLMKMPFKNIVGLNAGDPAFSLNVFREYLEYI